MVIRRIGNLNVQLVKDNFATRKHNIYELKSCPLQVAHLNCQFCILNFQLVDLSSYVFNELKTQDDKSTS